MVAILFVESILLKRSLTVIAFLLAAALMFYLTMPEKKMSNPAPVATAPEVAIAPETPENIVENTPKTQAVTDKCDTKGLRAAIDQAVEKRSEKLLSIVDDSIDIGLLTDVIQQDLNDHNLSYLIREKYPQPEESLDDFSALPVLYGKDEDYQKAFQSIQEDLLMDVMTGEAEKHLNQFLGNNINGLDSSDAKTKAFFAQFMLMAPPKKIEGYLNKLYPNNQPLPSELLSTAMYSIQDKTLLGRLFSRSRLDNKLSINLLRQALMSGNVAATELILEQNIHADSSKSSNNMIDTIYSLKRFPPKLMIRLLDKGFSTGRSASSQRFIKHYEKTNPELASRFKSLANQQQLTESQRINKLPSNIQSLLQEFKQEEDTLRKDYTDCLALEKNLKPKIPPYRIVEKVKIKAEIDQLWQQNVPAQQIVANYAGQNKETVEFAYKYLRQLRNRKNMDSYEEFSFASMPDDMRELMKYYKNKDWDKMVDLMGRAEFPEVYGVKPSLMVIEMMREKAPDSAIQAMANISDKNSIELLESAQYDLKKLAKLSDYGFNINARDQSNKNLLYQATEQQNEDRIKELAKLGLGVNSDPYGYDPLDLALRRNAPKETLSALREIGMPLTEAHKDYTLYLKTYYPERYKKVIETFPSLKNEGTWEPEN